MIFEREVNDYLNNDKFSNGLDVRISQGETKIPDRMSLLDKISAGKKVIHLGCVDHIPLIEQKIKNDTWLHARLCRSAKRCLGIDLNYEGIKFIKEHLGYEDVIYGDLISDDIWQIKAEEWDYIILGEMLEHLDNPVAFLSKISKAYSRNISGVIITVPNAFFWLNFKKVINHLEFINTDHRYWFTPYTLSKVVAQAGLKVTEFVFCEGLPEKKSLRRNISLGWHLRNYMLRKYPALRESLLLEAVF